MMMALNESSLPVAMPLGYVTLLLLSSRSKSISLLHESGWPWYFLWPIEYGRGDVESFRVEDLKGPCGICSHSLRTLGPPHYDKSPFYPIWGWEIIYWGKTRMDWDSLQRASTNCKACKSNHLGPSDLSQATQRWRAGCGWSQAGPAELP